MVAAPKTGMNWFKSDQMATVKIEELKMDYENLNMTTEINPEVDIKLEFNRKHTKFMRFDGRYFDNDLNFEDHINILVPPVI